MGIKTKLSDDEMILPQAQHCIDSDDEKPTKIKIVSLGDAQMLPVVELHQIASPRLPLFNNYDLTEPENRRSSDSVGTPVFNQPC